MNLYNISRSGPPDMGSWSCQAWQRTPRGREGLPTMVPFWGETLTFPGGF